MGLFDEPTLGIPSLSLKGVRKGLVVEGIVLPTQKINPRTGAVDLVAFREDPDRDQAGQPRLFPSGDPIMVGQVLLQTRLRGWDLTSAEFQMRTEQFPEEEDTGLRRWFIGSKYATKAVKAAMRSLRRPPEVGGTFAIAVTGIAQDSAQNGEKYVYPVLEVKWGPSTEDGKKVADAYAATLPDLTSSGDSTILGGDDPWSRSSDTVTTTTDEEPPF